MWWGKGEGEGVVEEKEGIKNMDLRNELPKEAGEKKKIFFEKR